jgi:hypothetical protein
MKNRWRITPDYKIFRHHFGEEPTIQSPSLTDVPTSRKESKARAVRVILLLTILLVLAHHAASADSPTSPTVEAGPPAHLSAGGEPIVPGQQVFGFDEPTTANPYWSLQTLWMEGRDEPPLIAHLLNPYDLSTGKWRIPYNDYFIFAIYTDGTAFFSRDTLIGGPPYYRKQLSDADMEYIRELLESLKSCPNLITRYATFNGSGHNICISLPGARYRMYSTHLLMESTGKCLATSQGYIESRGRCFDDIAHTEPSHFVEYRRAWDDLLALRDLFEGTHALLAPNLQTDHVTIADHTSYDFSDLEYKGATGWEAFTKRRQVQSEIHAEGLSRYSLKELQRDFSWVERTLPLGRCPFADK